MLVLDLTGLNCPLPVLKTKKFLSTLDSGTEVQITTSDPASFYDLQEFCQKTGHNLLYQQVSNDIITTKIKRK
ncbi:MAG: response regulator SirA [Burkholderiales bacterium]|jgi:tRNA 2-thiouridine synthesizing protein A|nr:response regulator SirA [Burkholderiales bacterium]MCE3268458.1 response regulator SirA [Burkholderiales bacterium]